MISWIKKNKLRVVLSGGSILLALLYVKMREPSSDNFELFGLRWLEAAVMVSLIISAFAYLIGSCIIREKGWSEFNILARFGLAIGALLYSLLLILFVIQWIASPFEFNILLIFIVIISFFIVVVDAFLNLPSKTIELDVIFFFTLFMTTILATYFYHHINTESFFSVGFHCGSAAFQLILVNLLFDPQEYINLFRRQEVT